MVSNPKPQEEEEEEAEGQEEEKRAASGFMPSLYLDPNKVAVHFYKLYFPVIQD